jgi:hypothetical protein
VGRVEANAAAMGCALRATELLPIAVLIKVDVGSVGISVHKAHTSGGAFCSYKGANFRNRI